MGKFNIEDTIGTSYNEMNCIKYVNHVYKNIHKKEMFLFFRIDDFEDNLKERIKLFEKHKHLAKYLKEPKEDCLVFFGKKFTSHIGYYKNGLIYHSTKTMGVSAESLSNLKSRFSCIEFVEYRDE